MHLRKATIVSKNVKQTEFGHQVFNPSHSITQAMKKELLQKVFKTLGHYITEEYDDENKKLLQTYLDEHEVSDTKRLSLEYNLLWWQLIYHTRVNPQLDFIEDFIQAHPVYLNQPFIISWLNEWKKAAPKFYYVEHTEQERVLVLVDMITQERLDVIVYDPLATPPSKGGVVAGTLIPIGSDIYFPIVDFYHFEREASHYIMDHLIYYYENYVSEDTLVEVFVQVLSIALQLERDIKCTQKINSVNDELHS